MSRAKMLKLRYPATVHFKQLSEQRGSTRSSSIYMYVCIMCACMRFFNGLDCDNMDEVQRRILIFKFWLQYNIVRGDSSSIVDHLHMYYNL